MSNDQGDGRVTPPPAPPPPAVAAAVAALAPVRMGAGSERGDAEEEWQMVSPQRSPQHLGSGARTPSFDKGSRSPQQSECSETGAQAELQSLALADSILASQGLAALCAPHSEDPGASEEEEGEEGEGEAYEAGAGEEQGGDEGEAAAGASEGAGPAAMGPSAGTEEAAAAEIAAPAEAAAAPGGEGGGEADAPATDTAARLAGFSAQGPAVGVDAGMPRPPAVGWGDAARAAAVGAGAVLCGAGAALLERLSALGRWVLRGSKGAHASAATALGAARPRLERMLVPLRVAAKDGRISWRNLGAGFSGGLLVAGAVALLSRRRVWHLERELVQRNRELSRLLILLMRLEDALASHKQPPPARHAATHHAATAARAAAFVGLARSSMAYL